MQYVDSFVYMRILRHVDELVYNAPMSLFTTPDLKDLPPRERILLTAHRLFYSEGIRATGVDRVIAESGVAKVTFYRQFPSKNELIQAFLVHRHEKWMDWFTGALNRHAGKRQGVLVLVPVLREWFADEGFRGCAFINGLVELGGAQAEVADAARSHKDCMTAVIAELLPASKHRQLDAEAIALAVDGAIVRAQLEDDPERALAGLTRLLKCF